MSKFTGSWLAETSEILGAEWSHPVNLLPGAALAADAASFTLMVDLAGDWSGTFTVTVDQTALGALLESRAHAGAAEKTAESDESSQPEPLSVEQIQEEWQRLFRMICLAAAGAVGKNGRPCEVAMISPEDHPIGSEGMGYQLHAGGPMVALLIADQAELAPEAPAPQVSAAAMGAATAGFAGFPAFGMAEKAAAVGAVVAPVEATGLELLLDVELEASLRFGSREMALSELLALGPGDVVQLDRALADPVDLIIGDKIVARGEVVLVNGNFGLQVLEVAQPRKSLETIRCLF